MTNIFQNLVDDHSFINGYSNINDHLRDINTFTFLSYGIHYYSIERDIINAFLFDDTINYSYFIDDIDRLPIQKFFKNKIFDYIIIEGVDTSGKTYLSKKLAKELISKQLYDEIIIVNEPVNISSYTNYFKNKLDDEYKNKIKLGCSTERIFVCNLIKYNEEISNFFKYVLFLYDRFLLLQFLKRLNKYYRNSNKNILVIQDRSLISSLCYQSIYIKDIFTPSEILDHSLKMISNIFLYKPDLLIYVDIEMKNIKKRFSLKHPDIMDNHAIENLENIYKNYIYLLKNSSCNSIISKDEYFNKISKMSQYKFIEEWSKEYFSNIYIYDNNHELDSIEENINFDKLVNFIRDLSIIKNCVR